MNNSACDKAIMKKINATLAENDKKCKTYKNELLGWKISKKIVSRNYIL